MISIVAYVSLGVSSLVLALFIPMTVAICLVIRVVQVHRKPNKITSDQAELHENHITQYEQSFDKNDL